MKKVASNIGLGLLALLMLLAVATFIAPQFGWRVDSVLSGSMEPALQVGGVVVTRPVEAEAIEEGDIITFYSPLGEALTTHRVVARVAGVHDGERGSGLAVATPQEEPSIYFRTKGDANEDEDPFIVPAQNVVGEVVFHLPYLGYVASFIQTRLGLLVTLFVPGLIIIILELRNIWQALTEKEAGKGNSIKEQQEK